ncbi:MAG TPA: hypothetical protein VGL38_11900 [bacterium]|jgi:hypothetical protein
MNRKWLWMCVALAGTVASGWAAEPANGTSTSALRKELRSTALADNPLWLELEKTGALPSSGAVWTSGDMSGTSGFPPAADVNGFLRGASDQRSVSSRLLDVNAELKKLSGQQVAHWRNRRQPMPVSYPRGPIPENLWASIHMRQDTVDFPEISADRTALSIAADLKGNLARLSDQSAQLEARLKRLKEPSASMLSQDKMPNRTTVQTATWNLPSSYRGPAVRSASSGDMAKRPHPASTTPSKPALSMMRLNGGAGSAVTSGRTGQRGGLKAGQASGGSFQAGSSSRRK